ncbi:MAG: SBBP repeat-containing protein [Bryobacteraceae bacterium]|nr:SBBP repeat-containing protein [Bryobacteraceae bacterium]
MWIESGSPEVEVTGDEPLTGRVHYLLGNDPSRWATEIPTYGRVRYEQVYPGIDLVFYRGESGQLEFDFVVAPGADPSRIGLRLVSRNAVNVTSDRNLVARTETGELVHKAPVVYQASDGERTAIGGRYKLDGNLLRFEIGEFDPSRTLVIDPVVLFASYLGGTGVDQGRGIALDADGNIYLTGGTTSPNFPTRNPLQANLTDTQSDVFVTKLNADATELIFSTYIGGQSGDQGRCIAVGPDGAAYVGGNAGPSFPATPGAFQAQSSLQGDAFLLKLNPSGSALEYATYLAGTRSDMVTAIAVDEKGNLFAAGHTASDDFPVTPGAAQAVRPRTGNSNDAFVVKLNPQGTALLYSTLVGGSDDDEGRAIALFNGFGLHQRDRLNRRTCRRRKGWRNFPTTAAFQAVSGGGQDAILAKIDPSADLGEPQIGCAAGFLAPLRPLIGVLAPRSIGTVFGINFSTSTGRSPQVGDDGLIATNLANTCLEIDGRRAPMYFVNSTQVNFQVPVETAPGWVRAYVIRSCGGNNEARSEPLFVEIGRARPQFFLFQLREPAIAAINDTETGNTGEVAIVGPASAGAPFRPATGGHRERVLHCRRTDADSACSRSDPGSGGFPE